MYCMYMHININPSLWSTALPVWTVDNVFHCNFKQFDRLLAKDVKSIQCARKKFWLLFVQGREMKLLQKKHEKQQHSTRPHGSGLVELRVYIVNGITRLCIIIHVNLSLSFQCTSAKSIENINQQAIVLSRGSPYPCHRSWFVLAGFFADFLSRQGYYGDTVELYS